MNFTNLNLHPKILQAIDVCGYTKPTPIQSKAIPSILDGNDLIATAQTGTGKTASYVLPGLQKLATTKQTRKPRILILAPTRELAVQITNVIGKYGKFLKVNIASFIGGVPYHKQLRELSKPIDIVIATPGRLMDHMENKRLDLSQIEILTIDEADRMLDMGFIDDIKTIVRATPKNRQTLLLSATMNSRLLSETKDLLKNPVKISISQDKIDTNLIKQKVYVVKDAGNKKNLLEELLERENIFKGLIFSSTKRNADKLALQLRDDGYSATPMHGDLKQSARNKTLTQFRQGKVQFLVATDVAARGIDVTDISHVINYDLPRFPEEYVHRIGRTGRAGKTGIAISIMLKSEIRLLKKIEQYIDDKIQLVCMTENGDEEIRSIDAPPARKKPRHKSKGRGNTKFGDKPKSTRRSGPGSRSKQNTNDESRFGDKPKRKRTPSKDSVQTKQKSRANTKSIDARKQFKKRVGAKTKKS